MEKHQMDPSGFVLLADYIPQIVQEIRYYSTYNFIGDRIDGYEEPCALLTKEAARALAVTVSSRESFPASMSSTMSSSVMILVTLAGSIRSSAFFS